MPGAEIIEKGGKFELKTRQPGTRKTRAAKVYNTKAEAEKAQKEFFTQELENLKDISKKVSDIKTLAMDEKAFNKKAAEVKKKLFKELEKQNADSKREVSESDISYAQIIAEMMGLNSLMDGAIFSSALAAFDLADVSSGKAPDGQRVVQAFSKYEEQVAFAVGSIDTRIAELETRKQFLNLEKQRLSGGLSQKAFDQKVKALGSAQDKKGSVPPGKWVVVFRSPQGNWKKWKDGKWVNAPKLDDNKFVRKRLDPKFYSYVKADRAAASKALNEKQRRFISFWREPDNQAKAPAKKAAPKTDAQAAKPKAKADTKAIDAEIRQIDKKLTMLREYRDAIEPEKATIDWMDTPHFLYHKYVGPGDRPTKDNKGYQKENFERYTLGQLASLDRETPIWMQVGKRGAKRWVKVNGLSDSQAYLFKYTNWRLNSPEKETKAEGQKPEEKVERVNVTSVTKIISGGQTGADRAGLYAGKDLGIETGGTAPKGFKTESKSDETQRLKEFGLTEVSDEITEAYTGGNKTYGPRTEQNVLNSDGTVLFGDESSSGSTLTKIIASKHEKPYLANPTAEELRAWIAENDIKTLNVAGNRYSVNKKLFNTARSTLVEALSDPKAEAALKPEANVEFDPGPMIDPISTAEKTFERDGEQVRLEIDVNGRAVLYSADNRALNILKKDLDALVLEKFGKTARDIGKELRGVPTEKKDATKPKFMDPISEEEWNSFTKTGKVSNERLKDIVKKYTQDG